MEEEVIDDQEIIPDIVESKPTISRRRSSNEDLAYLLHSSTSSGYQNVSRLLILGVIGLALLIMIVGAGVLANFVKTQELITNVAILQERIDGLPNVMTQNNREIADLTQDLTLVQAKLNETIDHLSSEAEKINTFDKRSSSLESSIRHIESDLVELTERSDRGR